MRSLGGYTLLERIASGPSSEIYIASDTREQNPHVFRAVKLVRPKLARDAVFVDALLKDAPGATRFRHRTSVDIHDVLSADGEVLIVQELVKARSLADVLERGETDKKPLARELVLWIAMEVAQLLEALHRTRWSTFGEEPMWHGALSPFDILIRDNGQIAVLGCGVGRARASVAPALDRLPYLAPEVVDGDAPTPLSDVYALGVIVYDALAGGRVFRRATVAETRAAITRGEFQRVAQRTDYANAIVDELIAQSMARWPESRPQSAAYVERALRSQVRGGDEAAAARLAEHMRRTFGQELEAFERTLDSARRRAKVEHEGDTDMFRALGAPSNDLAFGGVTEPMQQFVARASDPEVTEVPELETVDVLEAATNTEPQLLIVKEDLLHPADLLADLFESVEDEPLVSPANNTEPMMKRPPGLAAPVPVPTAPRESPSREPTPVDPSRLGRDPRESIARDIRERSREVPGRDPREAIAREIREASREVSVPRDFREASREVSVPRDVREASREQPVPRDIREASREQPDPSRDAPFRDSPLMREVPSAPRETREPFREAPTPRETPMAREYFREAFSPREAAAAREASSREPSATREAPQQREPSMREPPSQQREPSMREAPLQQREPSMREPPLQQREPSTREPPPQHREPSMREPPPRGSSRPHVPLTPTPVMLPVVNPATLQPPEPKQPAEPPRPPPLKPRAASTRATSTPGRATTSGAAEVAGAPARFLEKLASLLVRYELGQEIAKFGPISGIEAHVRDSRAPVLVLALDLDRMDDARLPRDEWIASFDRVLAIARKVTHPMLPRLVESGAQGSVRFAVLDHSEGASLSLVIGRGKLLGTEPVRKIIASLAVALQHLHERGVLFCNVQAHAVWLAREGHGRLIDFSMAAPIGGPLNTLLPTNIFALSPEYLRGREYSPASDQFALGALLYELLTQTRPFRGLDTDMIISAIRDKDPLPPHTMDSRVDRLLSDVAMRALDKDPGRRFNSMAELARLITSG